MALNTFSDKTGSVLLSDLDDNFTTLNDSITTTINDTLNSSKIAIGLDAGKTGQLDEAIAIGSGAGETNQNYNSVAIGSESGNSNQGFDSVAIGQVSALRDQGNQSVAIGCDAARSNQGDGAVTIGNQSGRYNQGDGAVALGFSAGYTDQGANAIALGKNAGHSNQGADAIAIGNGVGNGIIGQKANSIAIGSYAGYENHGEDSIAIGRYANYMGNGLTNSIVLNASGTYLNSPAASSLIIKPIRSLSQTPLNVLQYNTSTGEVNYTPASTAFQVVTNVYTGKTSYSVPTAGQTGTYINALDTAITPSRTTSKIRVEFNISFEVHQDTIFRLFRLVNGVTTEVRRNNDGNYWSGFAYTGYDADTNSTGRTNHYVYIDSPNTTSIVLYRLMIQSGGVGAVTFWLNRAQGSAGAQNYENAISQCILTEIPA